MDEDELGAKFRGGGGNPPPADAESVPTALERLKLVRGVSFEWIEGAPRTDDRPRELGVIAQEVEAAFPDAVVTHESGYKMVDYAGLVAALIESVKELAERVEQLEAERRT